MKRWALINSDEYIDAYVEGIIRSGEPIKRMRRLMRTFIRKYRNEILHGDQGSGCSNPYCKVCYPFRKPKPANK